MSDVEKKLERIALLEKKIEIQKGLPHLHGFPWYKWAWEFFTSVSQYNFLCAANQISKSSTQIRKCIHWATATELWPSLWPQRPLQFWYLYPSKNVATAEFEKKWTPLFMPRGKFKDDPKYGWEVEKKQKEIHAIHFRSGVSVYFKTYAQDVADLQTGSVDAIFCDEELPEELYSELNMRISATEGYFHMVFTATLGQEFWYETIEEKGPNERLKEAFKQQVSMFDCMRYMDGTPSRWTPEKIQKVINTCKSEAEVLRRVHGRFVREGGLKYPSFDKKRNLKPVAQPYEIPAGWLIYGGVDVGSGGEKGHPAAIAFVAVRPDFRKGRVFMGWRGDGIETTAADVYTKFCELRGNRSMTGQYYDWASKDFQTIATRNGEPFTPADKSQDSGEQILNVLFKNDMLEIDDIDELKPLVRELSTLQRDTAKTKAKDDFSDALRYCVTRIPWDWSAISNKPVDAPSKPLPSDRMANRRGEEQDVNEQLSMMVEDEIEAWNELYE